MTQTVTSGMWECLVKVLVDHQRANDPPFMGVCACGWGRRQLGASWAEHVADVFAESWAARGDR